MRLTTEQTVKALAQKSNQVWDWYWDAKVEKENAANRGDHEKYAHKYKRMQQWHGAYRALKQAHIAWHKRWMEERAAQ